MDSRVREGSRAMQEQKKQKLFFSHTTGCLGNSVQGGGGGGLVAMLAVR